MARTAHEVAMPDSEQSMKNLRFVDFQSLGFLLLFLVNLFWFLAAYPGNLSPDSLDSWNQVKTNVFDDWHPVAYQIYIAILSLGGRFLPLVSFFQLIITSTTLVYILRLVRPEWSVNRVFKVVAFICATPFVGPMQVTLWKDIPYNFLTLLGIVILLSNQLNRKYKKAIFILVLGSVFRHEGWITLGLGAFLFLGRTLFQRRQLTSKSSNLFKIPFALAIASILSALIGIGLVKATSATSVPTWLSSTSFATDIAWVAVKKPEVFSVSELQLIQNVNKDGYLNTLNNCDNLPFQLLGPNFNTGGLASLESKVPELWTRIFLSKNLRFIIQSRYCQSKAFIPFPLSVSPPKSGVEWTTWGVTQNHPLTGVLKSAPVVPVFDLIARNYIDRAKLIFSSLGNSVIAWPSLNFTFTLLLLLYLSRLYLVTSHLYAVMLFCLARLLTLIGIGAYPGYRYGLIIHLVMLVVISIGTISLKEKIMKLVNL